MAAAPSLIYGVIHLVRTHEGGGVDTSKYVHKSPFLHVLLLFITVLKNTCCDYFPVSQMFTHWIFKNIPTRNRGDKIG